MYHPGFFHLFHSYIDIKSKAATACNLHFLGVALNAFRVSMPRETTVPFTKKISIYPDTDGYRVDAAMKSRRKKRISLCVRSPGTHFRAIHTVKGGDKSDARCCLSHLSFVWRASCFNNSQNCIVDTGANIYRATRPFELATHK